MPTYKVFCYRITAAAVVELEATSHDTACEIALELFDHPDVHFYSLADSDGDPLDLAIKAPLETVVCGTEVSEEEVASWLVD